MAADSTVELTPRQRDLLVHVVEEYVETGQPVGSKHLVERGALTVSPSTVRSELAELEARGLLTHPHTSAGRVPTDRGYRFYAGELLARADPRPAAFPLDLSALRREVDSALEATTEMLSSVTRLLALVSAPPFETTTVRHVEILLLQPQTVMVVVITSTGGVSKQLFRFEEPVDTGLANWAREYLNERLAGVRLGSVQLRRQLEEPSLSFAERSFLDAIRPAFVELVRAEQRLYVGGTAGLLEELPYEQLGLYRRVLATLERRAELLEILGHALDPLRPFVRVGDELDDPALQGAALVGASYGLTNRVLGAVSLLGPLRMDYDKAIRSVRGAAHELSRFVEEVYEDD
ncbi:MAG TPA: heat-inducible transcriptional repressor HrcA [Gaiellaceae bacterium]|jgi:heat-inducible transcriptional repressor|nr:heat-inducible transcriptional repressor HrcA [Gaiellaceae bacterium]